MNKLQQQILTFLEKASKMNPNKWYSVRELFDQINPSVTYSTFLKYSDLLVAEGKITGQNYGKSNLRTVRLKK